MYMSPCPKHIGSLYGVQVYDRRKRLKRTMHLLEPILSVSFLNDKGDIVAALNKNLVVIRANSYQFLTADEMTMLVTETARNQQQPVSQATDSAQRAAMVLSKSGSTKHLHLARQTTLAQVELEFHHSLDIQNLGSPSACLLA